MKKWMFLSLFLILVLGLVLRFNPFAAETFSGPDPFFHARMSEQVIEGKGVPGFDFLSNQGRSYSYAPLFHVGFANLSIFSSLPVSFFVAFYPIIYALIGVLVVFVFSRKLFGARIGVFSAFLLAIMAMHLMRTSSYARPDGLSLMVIPAIIYLFYRKKHVAALLLSVFQVLLHPLSTVYLLGFLIIWGIVFAVKRLPTEWKWKTATVCIVVGVFLCWLNSLPYAWSDYVSMVSFESSELRQVSLMDFITLFRFAWIFALVGLVKLKDNWFLKVFFAFSLLYMVVGTRLGIFFAVPMALIGGFGFDFVYEKVKPHTKIFFVLVFLLAIISLAPFHPRFGTWLGEGEKAGMHWLNEFSPVDANLMNSWDRGHPLTYIAQRAVVMDGYFEFSPDLNYRNHAMKELITSSNCSKIESSAKKFNVNYFYLHRSALSSRDYLNGFLDSGHCDFENAVYQNDSCKIIEFKLFGAR